MAGIKIGGVNTKEDRKLQIKLGRAYSAWDNGYSTDEISKLTGLPIEKIEKLIPTFKRLKEKRSKEAVK